MSMKRYNKHLDQQHRVVTMKKILAGLAIVALAFPVATLADGRDGFAGLSYVTGSIAPNHATDHANVGALQFNFGGWLNQSATLGVEGRIGLGIKKGNVHYTTKGEREVNIKRYYGAYFRAQFPDSLPVRPYGLIGANRIETDEKDAGHAHHGKGYTDIGLGMGVDVKLARQVYVNLEYLRAADRKGYQVNLFGVGINGRF